MRSILRPHLMIIKTPQNVFKYVFEWQSFIIIHAVSHFRLQPLPKITKMAFKT